MSDWDKELKKIKVQTSKHLNDRTLQKYAKILSLQIRKRASLGFGVNKAGGQKRFKKLSPLYVKQRKGEIAFASTKKPNRKIWSYTPSKKPNLSRDTRPNMSNVTATGQLLESIYGKVFSSRKLILLQFKQHREYELYSQTSKIKNDEVYKWLVKQDREFFKLTKSEIANFITLVRTDLLSKYK